MCVAGGRGLSLTSWPRSPQIDYDFILCWTILSKREHSSDACGVKFNECNYWPKIVLGAGKTVRWCLSENSLYTVWSRGSRIVIWAVLLWCDVWCDVVMCGSGSSFHETRRSSSCPHLIYFKLTPLYLISKKWTLNIKRMAKGKLTGGPKRKGREERSVVSKVQ